MKGIRPRTVEIERDEALERMLKAFIEVDRSTKFIADYLAQKLGAKFQGIEKEALLKMVREMKGAVRRYDVLIAYSGNYIILGYPVAVVRYADSNRVSYRFNALMREFGRGYVVSGIERVDIRDVDRIFSTDVIMSMYGFLERVTSYHYELSDQEAVVDLDSSDIRKHGVIRLQGDLLMEYDVLDDYETLRGHIRGNVLTELRRIIANDLMRAISRKLSLMRIEHWVRGQTTIIPINISGGYQKRLDFKEAVKEAFKKMLLEMGLREGYEYYNLYARYRCPFGERTCQIEVEFNLNEFRLSEMLDNESIEELVDQAMVPTEYTINIGNHIIKFTAFRNYVDINMSLPFSGDTITSTLMLNSRWWYIDAGEIVVKAIHDEHGESTLKLHTTKPLAIRFLTIEKDDSHILPRNKIAINAFLERYK